MATTVADLEMNWSRGARIVVIVLFAAALLLPGAATYFPALQLRVELTENRQLKKFPRFKWRRRDTFPQKFEEAFNDQFGERDWLVRADNRMKVKLLGTSPTPRVIVGRDGWLYYGMAINDYRGLTQFPEEDSELWRREFAAKAAFFRERQIRYLVVIAPNKESIYPEFLPKSIRRLGGRSRFDQILERWQGQHDFEILDLREPLLRAKQELGRCYQRTDSHWNDLGGFVAAREIFRRLRTGMPDLPELSLADFKMNVAPTTGGDLSIMLGMQKELPEEGVRLIGKPHNLMHDVDIADVDLGLPINWQRAIPPLAFENQRPEWKRRLMVESDSFGTHPLNFLAPYFQHVLQVRPRVPFEHTFHEALPALIEQEHPDAFIEIFVERNLRAVPEHVLGDRKSQPKRTEDDYH